MLGNLILELRKAQGKEPELHLRWQVAMPLGGFLAGAFGLWYFVAVENAPLRISQLHQHFVVHQGYILASSLLAVVLGWHLMTLKRPVSVPEGEECESKAEGPTGKSRISHPGVRVLGIPIILLGLAVLGLGVLLPTYPVRRFTPPMVGVITDGTSSTAGTALKTALQRLRLHGSSPPLISGGSENPALHTQDFVQQLERLWAENPDFVLISAPNILSHLEENQLNGRLNPLTLYVVLGPVRQELLERYPNLIALGPSVLDEVFRISRLIPADAERIEVFRSDDPLGFAAFELLNELLPPTVREKISRSETIPETGRVLPAPGAVVVLLDWHRSPSDVLELEQVKPPCKLIGGSHLAGVAGVMSPRLLTVVSQTGAQPDSLTASAQALVVESIIADYYMSGRPVSVKERLSRVKIQAMRSTYSYFSQDGQLIYRYDGGFNG